MAYFPFCVGGWRLCLVDMVGSGQDVSLRDGEGATSDERQWEPKSVDRPLQILNDRSKSPIG